MSLTHRIIRLRQLASGDSTSLEHVLDQPHFTKKDVIDVTGVADHQLHNWVARKWLTLSGVQDPGKGNRRLYSGCDVVNVALALQLQPFGMMQVADRLSQTHKASNRAGQMLRDPLFKYGQAYAVVPSGTGEWHYVPFGAGSASSGHDFRAAVIVDADRIILETLERLAGLLQGSIEQSSEMPSNVQVLHQQPPADDDGDDYLFNPRRSASF